MNPADAPFDPRTEIIDRGERGQSFGLKRETYYRLATCALNCSAAGIEPSEIRILADGSPGCVCTLYGSQSAFEIEVRPPQIILQQLALDFPEVREVIFTGTDHPRYWARMTKAVFAAEGCSLHLADDPYHEC